MRGNQKMFVCMLLAVVFVVPLSVGVEPVLVLHDGIAVSEAVEADGVRLQDPQIEDRIMDVKFFGVLPVFPQWYLQHVDFVSATFYEESDTPAMLYLSLELRDLKASTDRFNAIYAVGWTYNNRQYTTGIHVLPDGPLDFTVGRSIDENDDIDQVDFCDGIFDTENNILTWEIPKTAVGDPSLGSRLYNIHPHTHLRPTGMSLLPPIDLFKDVVKNAITTADYTIQY